MAASTEKSPSVKLSESNAEFAKIFQNYIDYPIYGNISIPPLSISMALAMTYLGAYDETKTWMGRTMHFNRLEDTELHDAFNTLRQAPVSADQPYQQQIVNRLFGEKSFEFLDDYLGATEKFYGAQLEQVDFIDDFDGATKDINKWIADNTEQKIPNLLLPEALNSQTRLVIVNTSLKRALTADAVQNIRELQSNIKLPLSENLKLMGTSHMFSQDDANFSGIDVKLQLFVSEIFYQSVVDVNEEGTEAVAATSVVVILNSVSLHEIKREVQEKILIAEELRNQSNIEEATQMLTHIRKHEMLKLSLFERTHQKSAITDARYRYYETDYLNLLGNLFYDIGDYKPSLECYNNVQTKLIGCGFTGKVHVYKRQGDCFRKLEMYPKALNKYNYALKIFNRDSDSKKTDKAAIHNAIGLVHMDIEHYDQAVRSFKKALQLHNKNPLYYCNNGAALEKLEKDTEALNSFKTARELIETFENLNSNESLGLTHRNIAYIKNTLDIVFKIEGDTVKMQKKVNCLIGENEKVKIFIKKITKDYVQVKKEYLCSLIESLQQKDVEIKTMKQHHKEYDTRLGDLERAMEQMLKDYDKILEHWLKSSNVSDVGQTKITQYYKSFVETISSTYTAAQAVNSGWIEEKKSLLTKLASAACSVVPDGEIGAHCFEILGDVSIAALSSAVSLFVQSGEAVVDFELTMSIKTEARKAGRLAYDHIDLNKKVSQKALEIVENQTKRKQILDVSMDGLKQLPNSLLPKIKQLCSNAQDKIDVFLYGEKYFTAAQLLGAIDAHTLLDIYYKSVSSGEAAFSEAVAYVINNCGVHTFCDPQDVQKTLKSLVGDHVGRDIEDNIFKLCKLATKGKWKKSHKKPFAKKACKDLFAKKYLRNKNIPDEKIEEVQMLMFNQMCKALVKSGDENMICVTGFANDYPNVLNKIAAEYPEYFVNGQVVRAAIPQDINLQSQVLHKVEEHWSE